MKLLFDSIAHGHRFDARAAEQGIAITVELKALAGTVMSDWWISGPNREGATLVLANLKFGLGPRHENGQQLIRDAFESIVVPLLPHLVHGGGLPSLQDPADQARRKDLCLAHLHLHDEMGTFSGAKDSKTQTAAQYKLVKSFGLKAARPLLAELLGLPLSTVSRRIYLAREAGILPKTSEDADIKD